MKFYFSEPTRTKRGEAQSVIHLSSNERRVSIELLNELRSEISTKFGQAVASHAGVFSVNEIAEPLIDDCGTVALKLAVFAGMPVEKLRERLIAVGMVEGLPAL